MQRQVRPIHENLQQFGLENFVQRHSYHLFKHTVNVNKIGFFLHVDRHEMEKIDFLSDSFSKNTRLYNYVVATCAHKCEEFINALWRTGNAHIIDFIKEQLEKFLWENSETIHPFYGQLVSKPRVEQKSESYLGPQTTRSAVHHDTKPLSGKSLNVNTVGVQTDNNNVILIHQLKISSETRKVEECIQTRSRSPPPSQSLGRSTLKAEHCQRSDNRESIKFSTEVVKNDEHTSGNITKKPRSASKLQDNQEKPSKEIETPTLDRNRSRIVVLVAASGFFLSLLFYPIVFSEPHDKLWLKADKTPQSESSSNVISNDQLFMDYPVSEKAIRNSVEENQISEPPTHNVEPRLGKVDAIDATVKFVNNGQHDRKEGRPGGKNEPEKRGHVPANNDRIEDSRRNRGSYFSKIFNRYL